MSDCNQGLFLPLHLEVDIDLNLVVFARLEIVGVAKGLALVHLKLVV